MWKCYSQCRASGKIEKTLLTLDANAVATALPYDQLIEALKKAFSAPVDVPQRAHYEVSLPNGTPGTLLLVPAWQPGSGMGVKIATVFADNAKLGKPAVFASYLLMSARTGVPVAMWMVLNSHCDVPLLLLLWHPGICHVRMQRPC